jgi:uncharacterized membrane protein (TIGR02234 family)
MADRSRRAWYGPTLIAGLAGAGATVLAAARPWVTGSVAVPGITVIHAGVDGASLAPVAAALGYVLLAGFGAVIATRGWVRAGLGVLIIVAAALVIIQVVAVPADVGAALHDALQAKGYPGTGEVHQATSWWRWAGLAGAVLAMAAGGIIVRFGAHFAVMGTRYDAVSSAPVASTAPTRTGADEPAPSGDDRSEAEIWRAIDRGDDPTGER